MTITELSITAVVILAAAAAAVWGLLRAVGDQNDHPIKDFTALDPATRVDPEFGAARAAAAMSRKNLQQSVLQAGMTQDDAANATANQREADHAAFVKGYEEIAAKRNASERTTHAEEIAKLTGGNVEWRGTGRVLVALLAAISLTALAACSGTPAQQTSSSKATVSASEAALAAAGHVIVSCYAVPACHTAAPVAQIKAAYDTAYNAVIAAQASADAGGTPDMTTTTAALGALQALVVALPTIQPAPVVTAPVTKSSFIDGGEWFHAIGEEI